MTHEAITAVRPVLKRLRAQRGLKQIDLCRSIEISQNYLSLLESGDRIPSLPALALLARALGVSASEILAAAEQSVAPVKNEDTPESLAQELRNLATRVAALERNPDESPHAGAAA